VERGEEEHCLERECIRYRKVTIQFLHEIGEEGKEGTLEIEKRTGQFERQHGSSKKKNRKVRLSKLDDRR